MKEKKNLGPRGLAAGLLLAAVLAIPALAADEIGLTFGETTVTVTGVSPGAEVILYTISRRSASGVGIVEDATYRLSDEDADGAVVLELDGEVPFRSLWIAVDMKSGASAIEQAAIGVREVDFAERGRLQGAGLQYRLDHFYVFLARAPLGAWKIRTGDGGSRDHDGQPDGWATVHPATMNPLVDSPPPPGALAAQDLIVVIDPRRMRYAVVPGKE